jgi:hypothetical protein
MALRVPILLFPRSNPPILRLVDFDHQGDQLFEFRFSSRTASRVRTIKPIGFSRSPWYLSRTQACPASNSIVGSPPARDSTLPCVAAVRILLLPENNARAKLYPVEHVLEFEPPLAHFSNPDLASALFSRSDYQTVLESTYTYTLVSGMKFTTIRVSSSHLKPILIWVRFSH